MKTKFMTFSIVGLSSAVLELILLIIIRSLFFKYVEELEKETVIYFVLFSFLILLLINFISIYTMDKLIRDKLKKFYDFMWNVGKTRDPSARINIIGSDELSELANCTNAMLKELDECYEDMKVLKERFKLTLEATNDGYICANLIEEQIYISQVWLKYLGYDENSDTVDIESCLRVVADRDDREKVISIMNKCKSKEIDSVRCTVINCWRAVAPEAVLFHRWNRPFTKNILRHWNTLCVSVKCA